MEAIAIIFLAALTFNALWFNRAWQYNHSREARIQSALRTWAKKGNER